MKNLIASLVCLLFTFAAFSQPKEVTLVVTGEGATKEEATNNALRSAIEQTYGVFVSANSEILDDELVKDDIATVASGNVKSFQEIAYIEKPSGEKVITLQVVVSIGKLVAYSKSHGSEAEFAGATFQANYNLYKLNRQSSQIAIGNLYRELAHMASSMYDYKLTVSDPVILDDKIGEVEMIVDVVANSHTQEVGNFYFKSLESLSYDEKVVRPYSDMGNTFYAYYFHSFSPNKVKSKLGKLGKFVSEFVGGTSISSSAKYLKVGTTVSVSSPELASYIDSRPTLVKPQYTYVPLSCYIINSIFLSSGIYGFEVHDNLGNTYHFSSSDNNTLQKGKIPRIGQTNNPNFDYYSHVYLTNIQYSLDDTNSHTNDLGFYFFPGSDRKDVYLDYQDVMTGIYPIDRQISRLFEYGSKKWEDDGSLLNKTTLEGIISNNLGYSPGTIIYSVKEKIRIDLETLYKITSFSVEPRSSGE